MPTAATAVLDEDTVHPGALPDPAVETAAKARVARYEQAKAEAKAAQEDPTVPTPNHDAIVAGVKIVTPRAGKTPVEPVKAPAGFVAIQLASDRHAEIVGAHLTDPARIEGLTLLVRSGNAQTIADKLSNHAKTTDAEFERRVCVATLVRLRNLVPKVTDPNPTLISRVVDLLNATDGLTWSVVLRSDGQLTWTVTDAKGKAMAESVTASAVAQTIGLVTQRATPAPRAPRAERAPRAAKVSKASAATKKLAAIRERTSATKKTPAKAAVGK